MSRCESPLWAIETVEEQHTAGGAPRSLWDRIESHLRPQENQNKQTWQKIAARPTMAPGLERTLLEAHLRLLLGKLGVPSGNQGGKGGLASMSPSSSGGGGGSGCGSASVGRPRPHTFREDDLCRRSSTRPCCATTAGSPGEDSSPRRKCLNGRKASYARRRSSSSSSCSEPTTPYVPLETQQDRAVYEFLSTSGECDGLSGGAAGRGGNGTHGEAERGGSEGAAVGNSRSRPGTGRRPGSSRSARSAPECLESGRCVTVATIDTALGELRAAFEEEAQNLLEEVADLTGLLEDEAAVKADDERQSRRHLGPKAGDYGGKSNAAAAAANDPIPSSELRRYGKKLEEAVRSREHAADVAQRLALPRQRAPGLEPGCGGKDGKKKGRGGMTVAPVSRSSRSSEDLPGSTARLESSRHRGPGVGRKASIGRGSGSIGSGPSVEDKARGEDKAVGRRGGGGERGALATKLRGAVRASREEEVVDDDKYWK
ncbi:hypothetical protein Esi_0388_0014 [Ectocarpus siliculosus]|uniref:Uncharacterized protein n=1 Tax=Ectocarpus siliculosus TaxID=2880 RepID=D8LM71_ECTSI|nr:hypothetical protein Esi_0388_0014 [Ectocarpus siliculosus]|eukprot:CBN79704.1 hypothetical protein Esi_0388_0014 [Ectocarpus siliculosus]